MWLFKRKKRDDVEEKKAQLEKILGRQIMYVTYMSLHKSYLEAELLGNHIRAGFIEGIMEYFDTD